ncbi:MAG: hypothetical protein CSA76_02245 [Spirochaetales bacterium]|nr:MAG: hypothetical protein CSA76_02245 [Spirochaetales bacterium]
MNNKNIFSRASFSALFCFFAVLGALPCASFARQWPDSQQALVSSFAAARQGAFSRGLHFETSEERVQAWGDGELIWSSSEYNSASLPGKGLVVLEHEDGFRSTYEGVDVRPDLKDKVSEGDWLGYSGISGWSFIVTDFRQGRIVDPLGLLPARVIEGRPRLGSIELSRGSEVLPVTDRMQILPGRWSLTVDAVYTGISNTVPVEISLYWLGTRVGFVKLDSLEEQDGVIVLNAPGPLNYEAVYSRQGYFVFNDIAFNEGRGILELRLKDEKGKVLSRVWNLVVRNVQ